MLFSSLANTYNHWSQAARTLQGTCFNEDSQAICPLLYFQLHSPVILLMALIGSTSPSVGDAVKVHGDQTSDTILTNSRLVRSE